MKTSALLGTIATIAPLLATAQPPAPTPREFRIVKLDPALDAIVSPDAKLELLGDRFGLTEGPVWVPDVGEGYLLFSDLISNVIYKWTPDGAISVHLERSGYSGDDITHAGYQTRRGWWARTACRSMPKGGSSISRHRTELLCASSPMARAPSSRTVLTASASTVLTTLRSARTAQFT
jgi:sugar lactone lactonase YvrE